MFAATNNLFQNALWMLLQAARRADKWKARCGELRRALADSRQAAALCGSLKVPMLGGVAIMVSAERT